MKYVLFLKDNIAAAKSCYKSLYNIEIGLYDSYVEVTENDYDSICLPSKKVDDTWVQTDTFPNIDYPQVVPEPPSADDGVTWDALAAAYTEGVNEA